MTNPSLRRLVWALQGHRPCFRAAIEEALKIEVCHLHESQRRQSAADLTAVWRVSVSTSFSLRLTRYLGKDALPVVLT